MAAEKSSLGGNGAPASHHLAATLAAYEERHLPRGAKGLALAAPMRQSELRLRQCAGSGNRISGGAAQSFSIDT